MTTQGKNFTKMEIGLFEHLSKVFVGNELGLTGCEVSVNRLPVGKAAAFVHAHKKNEELYIITGGDGTFFIDGNEFPIQEGSLIRVAPAGERALKAGNMDLYYICIQAQEGSLTQATQNDGIRLQNKASWMD